MLLSVLTVGCGGHQTTGQHGPSATGGERKPVIAGPGRLFPIGGRRSLYLHCEGPGRLTVILEVGGSNVWSDVQVPLGRATRTCAYDRAGMGNSLPNPGVHTAADEIGDLKRLLDHAGIPPPDVLAGHAYGGLLVRLFAHDHPHETAGLVLIDSMGRNEHRRLEPIWQAQPAQVRQQIPEPTANPAQRAMTCWPAKRLTRRSEPWATRRWPSSRAGD